MQEEYVVGQELSVGPSDFVARMDFKVRRKSVYDIGTFKSVFFAKATASA
jgi:hypothetical protein